MFYSHVLLSLCISYEQYLHVPHCLCSMCQVWSVVDHSVLFPGCDERAGTSGGQKHTTFVSQNLDSVTFSFEGGGGGWFVGYRMFTAIVTH